jgi:glycosyltransferase involved in cell wall biosynthesis
MTKILYVCPFAHYSGHHPHVGIIDDLTPRVSFTSVIPRRLSKFRKCLKKLRSITLLRWLMMLAETEITLFLAVYLYYKDKYDVIHLRDGDPFLFAPLLLAFFFDDIKWAISVTGSVLYAPKTKWQYWFKRPALALYSLALNLTGNKLWEIPYKAVMITNKIIIMPQNEKAEQDFGEYLHHTFKGHIMTVKRGVNDSLEPMDKTRARVRLGLPEDKLVLLSFGAPHQGKCMPIIFQAVAIANTTYLIHAGKHSYSLGGNPEELAKECQLDGRCKVFDYFIPEDEKVLFFSCADAVILSYTKIFSSTSSMLLEAAKFNRPVIASNNIPLAQDIKDYKLGLVFEAENAVSLASTIKEFQKLSPCSLKTISNNCNKYIEDHSISKWAKDCEQVYKKLGTKIE